MERIFLTVLNMSITGAFVILAICIARLPLRLAPKIISYCLWIVAGFRLVFPFSFESFFSLMPFGTQPIGKFSAFALANEYGISYTVTEQLTTFNMVRLYSYVWFTGAAGMLLYGVASYFILKHRIKNGTHVIVSPFVIGFFSPKIYLPDSLTEDEREYIMLHEQTHIGRGDHIIKFLAYAVLCLHWFNPMAWLAFWLMATDMEMSCDECVLQKLGNDVKKSYAMSLVNLATEKRLLSAAPLSFGERGIHERVKNVMNFKKHSKIFVAFAAVTTVIFGLGFMLNRAEPPMEEPVTTPYPTEALPSTGVMAINADGEIIFREISLDHPQNITFIIQDIVDTYFVARPSNTRHNVYITIKNGITPTPPKSH
ncbi:MAG: M56 family metallopeptidase [Defluviitaleaceae bacterium]|nr:M56 family metallopeptidase [Defluviitaleaceae bacterium]